MPPLPALTLNAWMRYDVIRRALDVAPSGSTVLEIGAGQGAVGVRLALQYQYTGLEPDPRSAQVARVRIEAAGGRLLEMVAGALPNGERYDVVCAFEVLEHLEDDVAALRSWLEHLRPGGLLVLSVPAFQSRFAAADRQVGHYRRYDPELLRSQLEGAGLTNVEVWITGFPFGLLLEHGRNLLATIRPKTSGMETRTLESGRWQQPPAALGWATAVFTLPFRWVQRLFVRTRLGTGIVACARLPP